MPAEYITEHRVAFCTPAQRRPVQGLTAAGVLRVHVGAEVD